MSEGREIMTYDEIDDLNRWLAEKVCRLEDDEQAGTFVRDFKPISDLYDRELVLDAIERDRWAWKWEQEDGYHWFFMFKRVRGFEPIHSYERLRTLALCKVITKAYGWQENHVGR